MIDAALARSKEFTAFRMSGNLTRFFMNIYRKCDRAFLYVCLCVDDDID
ncbi:hypothetical protein NIES2104_42200 [Leptolyngbya sp. NIES-2104]|nr:hypothetical protein NIES2104_42200 [Leptolyngbya sp. NIES-2104]